MSLFTAAARAFAFDTPPGPDAFVVDGLHGAEGLSELFRFDLDLLAEADTDVPFDRLLGQPAALEVRSAAGEVRTVHGIVSRLTQGGEVRGPYGGTTLVRYRAVLVPAAWKLTRRRGCRIFQQKAVPDILRAVFGGLRTRFALSAEYQPRDYCVQYRETDWAFACRLMEEEGIFYFFDHAGGADVLVLGDHPIAHPPVPGPAEIAYDPARHGTRLSDRVTSWEKSQEVRSGRVALWDHTFELPHHNLEATADLPTRVMAGRVEHRPAAGGADLEAYDYPAAVAQRFDGISPGGAPQGDLRQVFPEAEREARLRAEAEAAAGLEATGESTARHLAAGHTFALAGHFNADGEYVLTRVTHRGRAGELAGGGTEAGEVEFLSRFRCIPVSLAFRPPRATPKPVVSGTQSAVVVGPPGEEIFTDKYGRVKVQFPWDREGKHDADSSCWVRVSQVHAGARWGGIDIPRAGEEVVVAFEEGDPDRPIVIGRVYNARELPPFDLPGQAMVSGLKSNTYPGGGGFNEISMDDTKGNQRMFIHAQHNQDSVVGNNRTAKVAVDDKEKVGGDQSVEIDGKQTVKIKKEQKVDVGTDQKVTVGSNQKVEAGDTIVISAGTSITLKCGAAKIHMNQAGVISISGTLLKITGSTNLFMAAPFMEMAAGVLMAGGAGLTLLEGGVTHVGGAALTRIDSGAQLDLSAGSDLVAKGAAIKLNG